MTRALAIALAILASMQAAPAGAQVFVDRFAGPRGGAIRRQIVAALEPDVEVTEARTEGSRAIVEGRVGRVGRGWRARVRVLASDGRELHVETLGARQVGALTGRVRRWAEDDLVALIASIDPPAAAASAPAPAPAPVVAAAVRAPARSRSSAPAPARLPAPLTLRVGVGVVGRELTYNDDIFGALPPYSLPAAPTVHVSAEWFPGGHADLGLLSGLSVRAEGEGAIAVETVGADGGTFGSDFWSIALGLAYRLRIDDFELRADAGYRALAFTIHPGGETQRPPGVPSVEIHAIRAGGGFRLHIGRIFFFFGDAAYLAPLALGEIASDAWFPRASAGGVEGDAGLGLRIDDVEVRGSFAMRRFFYDMRSEPGDARVAGGAVDQYLSGVLELAWTPSQLRQ